MADALDMSLDDLISKSRSTHQRLRGRGPTSGGGGPGPAHTALRRRFNSRAAAAPYLRRAAFSFKTHSRPMVYAGHRVVQPQPPMVTTIDKPTKLYISNLDYGVSNDNIKELFSDVGDIKRYFINYDRSGGSKGTADVIFSRRSDALAAVKRYNNVQLDGKPMKIGIIGTNIEAPPPPTAIFSFNPPAGSFNLPFKSWPGRGGAGGWPQSRGGFGGCGHGGRGHGRGRGRGRGEGRGEKVSAEDLDTDLDKYHAAAMETS